MSELSAASLDRAAAILAEHGVVRLRQAWAADDELVEPVVAALQENFDGLAGELEAKVGRGSPLLPPSHSPPRTPHRHVHGMHARLARHAGLDDG